MSQKRKEQLLDGFEFPKKIDHFGIFLGAVRKFLKKKYPKGGRFTQFYVALEILNQSSPQYISSFERGMCEPSNEAQVILMDYYGIPPEKMYELRMELQAEKYLALYKVKKRNGSKR